MRTPIYCPNCNASNPPRARKCYQCRWQLSDRRLHPSAIQIVWFALAVTVAIPAYFAIRDKSSEPMRVTRSREIMEEVSLALKQRDEALLLGKLPNTEQIEKSLKVWALPSRDAILRGRPLTIIPFTRDATKDETWFSLYVDASGTSVAITATIVEEIRDDDQGLCFAQTGELLETITEAHLAREKCFNHEFADDVMSSRSSTNASARSHFLFLDTLSDRFLAHAIRSPRMIAHTAKVGVFEIIYEKTAPHEYAGMKLDSIVVYRVKGFTVRLLERRAPNYSDTHERFWSWEVYGMGWVP